MPNAEDIIAATHKWIDTVIVKYNFCPFARKELEGDSIDYVVCRPVNIDQVMDEIQHQCQHLDNHPQTATTLVLLAEGFEDFELYLDLIELIQTQIIDPDYQGIYQIASFHPDYCFAGAEADDPANYTNRAPYPTVHIIREADIEAALAHYPDPESIPDKNIALARRKGLQTMAKLLAQCHQDSHSTNNQ